MLKSLSIQNFALIQSLQIAFHPDLSVITGETGAGKSIMLGALNMILGQRADLSAIIDKTRKCVIEAQFDIEQYNIQSFFELHDLDFEPSTIIRREITASGKSRAFINDTPVTLEVLRNLTGSLIDIHSQHENLLLNDSRFQLQIVDGMVQNNRLFETYIQEYKKWKLLRSQLYELESVAHKAAVDRDYFQFQYDQLEEAQLNDPDEQIKLELELETLTHAEEIRLALNTVSEALADDDNGAIKLINTAYQAAQKSSKFLPETEKYVRRLDSVIIELKDIAEEVLVKGNDVEYSPERIEIISARLNVLNDLQFKHRLDGIDALISLREELSDKLLNISGYDDKIEDMKQALKKADEDLKKSAEKLSQSRIAAIPKLEKSASALLHELGMPNAVLAIEHTRLNEYIATGADRINFLFTSNKNNAPQVLAKIASGGEKSRLMLALKALLTSSKSLPTIIFDEIDTGISGAIASKMGKIMQRMGQNMQVITITHLPQIAACGKYHYKVFKTDDDKPTSQVVELSEDARLHEIAGLISSEEVTESALKHAREMIGN